MSEPHISATTDAATPSPSPFTMVTGDPAAMVCEGDVCYIPAPVVEGPTPAR